MTKHYEIEAKLREMLPKEMSVEEKTEVEDFIVWLKNPGNGAKCQIGEPQDCEVLSEFFLWDKTPQGNGFWAALSDRKYIESGEDDF